MRSLPLSALVLGALVLAACATGSPASPAASAPSSGAPAGGEMTYEDLDGNAFIVTGAEGYEIVPDSTIEIAFNQGRIAIEAGCNTMGSQYRIENNVLSVGQLVSTEMACEPPLMAQDLWISNFIFNSTVTLEGDTMTLSKDGVTLTLTDSELANPDRPLEGTTWNVEGLIDVDAISTVPAGVEASLVFADGQVEVAAGCNTGSGPADITDTTITFGAIATTRMACGEEAMNVESLILTFLQGEVGYTISADMLTMTNDDGGILLRAAE